jgi:NADH dehydrogenase [ubiquinone] 1 alpha subcomplex assembly factor 1
MPLRHGRGADDLTILDFQRGEPSSTLANDVLMGGCSSSSYSLSSQRTGVFEGMVSFENGGGFASVGISLAPTDLSSFTVLKVCVLGDGHVYQLRLRGSDQDRGIAYRARFRTHPDEWMTIPIPLASFEPTRRGRRPENAPPLPAANIGQIGFLVGDRQEGPFRLEIDWVCGSGSSVAGPGPWRKWHVSRFDLALLSAVARVDELDCDGPR